MVSVGGNLYSVPDATRKRIVEVHTLANEVQIFEDGSLIAFSVTRPTCAQVTLLISVISTFAPAGVGKIEADKLDYVGSGSGVANTLSILRPSRSTISNRQPYASTCSPTFGIVPNC